MKAWGNNIQVFIGLWIIAGLAVMGINGYALMSLMDEPLAAIRTAYVMRIAGFSNTGSFCVPRPKKYLQAWTFWFSASPLKRRWSKPR